MLGATAPAAVWAAKARPWQKFVFTPQSMVFCLHIPFWFWALNLTRHQTDLWYLINYVLENEVRLLWSYSPFSNANRSQLHVTVLTCCKQESLNCNQESINPNPPTAKSVIVWVINQPDLPTYAEFSFTFDLFESLCFSRMQEGCLGCRYKTQRGW